MPSSRIITRTIWVLSLVSLLTDMASEMLYPIIPVYLKEIGFSFLLLVILEGAANFTAVLSNGYFDQVDLPFYYIWGIYSLGFPQTGSPRDFSKLNFLAIYCN